MNPVPVQDACTLWPDVWFGKSITHCCVQHDLIYDKAFQLDRAAKVAADFDLASCIATATGHPFIAIITVMGVSLFGGIFWGKAKRRGPSDLY